MALSTDVATSLRRVFRGIKNAREPLGTFLGALTLATVAGLSGFLLGKGEGNEASLSLSIVERPAPSEISIPVVSEESGQKASVLVQTTPSRCLYAASRNSKLFHLSTCAVVKRIKDENKLCFASPDEARARGFRAGCMK